MPLSLLAGYASARDRWTAEEANQWYAKQPWLVGCNFLPSTAINQLEMWQADTFDPAAIDRELGWAAQTGFNSVRVFLHNLLWDQDREGFLKRVEDFLDVAGKHGIGVVMTPLDGVWDPQPKLGKQPDPRPHVHNSGWVQAPGSEILADPERHDELRPYIEGLIRHFRHDPRIQVWDLFNEPENLNDKSYGAQGTKTELANKEEMATLLLKKLFVWAREADPSQPLTAGIWRADRMTPATLTPIDKTMLEESDVLSFHCYDDLPQVRKIIDFLRSYGRPILCTEYMARGNGSHFDPILGYFKEHNIGAYNWGLVAGKSQTQYPWNTWEEQFTSEPKLWHHDLFHADGIPYDPKEIGYIKKVTGKE
jgi:hypothetical protein